MPDYMVDPQERGFGPPNMAAQLFGMISSLPNAYQEGVKQKFERGQMARVEELQKPVNLEDGKLDYSALVQKYLQAKGTEAIPDVLPNAWKTQFLQNEQPTPSPYGPQNPRMSPDAHTGKVGQNEQPDSPEAPVGQYSISDLATRAGGLSDPKAAAANIAKAVGVAPGARLTADQEDKVRKILAPYTRQGDTGEETGTTGAAQSPAARLRALGESRLREPGAAQPGQFGQFAQAGAAVPSGAAGMVPPGTDPRSYAQSLKQAAERLRAQARREGIAGIPSKANEDQAAAYDKTADAILNEIGQAGQPTGPMKEARDQPVQEAARQREIDKLRTEDFQKNKAAIFKAGQQAEESIPQIEISRRIVNSPGFNSGRGHEFFDAVQSVSQQLFGGTALKNPGEIYDKFRSGEVLNQIRSLGAAGVGAVRVPEMKAVDKLIADRDIQAPGIRAVTEVESRLQKRVRDIYYQAQEYLQTHRELDDGFSKQVSEWKNKNHLFSKAELARPDLLSMPVFENPTEMRVSKMPSGTAFRTPNGEVGHIP